MILYQGWNYWGDTPTPKNSKKGGPTCGEEAIETEIMERVKN
jgi:hypothetical protein